MGRYPPPKGSSDVIGLECVGYVYDHINKTIIEDQKVMCLLPGGGYA